MTLVRLNNRYASPEYNDHWNRLMEAWLGSDTQYANDGFVPASNIIEKEKSFVIELAVPGFDKKDIAIKVENNLLVVSAEDKDQEDNENSSVRYIRREFGKGKFSRSFRLSKWVDHEKIQATFRNGILEIEVAKKEEVIAKPSREIKIS